jgi:hypothetical protein
MSDANFRETNTKEKIAAGKVKSISAKNSTIWLKCNMALPVVDDCPDGFHREQREGSQRPVAGEASASKDPAGQSDWHIT